MKNPPEQNPMKILWIEREDSDYTPIETVPSEFIPLILPYAGVYFNQDADCDTLSQNIKLPDFSIWSHEIYAHENIILAPQTPYQILALHFMEADGVVADISHRGLFLLNEKEVNLFNLHARFHTAQMEAGNVIFSFHVNILPASLPKLINKYPELQHLASMEIDTTSGPLNKKPYKISAACQELITAIYKCRLIEEQAKYYLHRCCIDLYINFARQDKLSGIINKVSPAMRITLKAVFDHLKENIKEVFNINRLASLYEVPVTELKEAFEQMFFISPKAFAHQQKMMAAYSLVVKTKQQLSFIAEETGFKSWNALRKAFEAYYGYTPISVRNAQ
ncbi:AraC-like DNA-binding protein [Chitinophaga niastensis]|uniref:AraC-like DNA-binding protein n=1 Tax=Chitinophaga niastensis TaxID=536980 RepID=A0A2P8HQ81_CHINA|nr:AraC family transcriptional regulator [Chitinophaga niastensis]PSL48355.1 AraC-like DNA-binding protein [Chitinophaga niastensis]